MAFLIDVLKTVLLPGDISTTTVSDLPVDISPRYVVEQEIIPFRSVRSPLLTPIRDVKPILRTPIKPFAPVRGRLRNIPNLPEQQGSRLMPFGDPDARATGFSGITPTINRSLSGYGNMGQGDDEMGGLPLPKSQHRTRIAACVQGSYSVDGCNECCETSFPKNPFKRLRCKKKCSSLADKTRPLPSTNRPTTSSTAGLGYVPGPGRFIASMWGQGGDSPVNTYGIGKTDYFVESVACKSWFTKKGSDNQCGVDPLKVGLIAAAVFLVMMK